MPASRTTTKFLTRSLVLGAVAAVAALASGCGASVSVSTGGSSVNSDEVASKIQSQYPGQAGGLKLTQISCESPDAKVGETFTCNGTNSASIALEFTGKITSLKSDTSKANFNWAVSKATAQGSYFADSAVKALKNEGSAVESMKCPDGIVIKKGAIVNCTATMDNDAQRPVKLTLTNNDGAFHVDLAGPAGATS